MFKINIDPKKRYNIVVGARGSGRVSSLGEIVNRLPISDIVEMYLLYGARVTIEDGVIRSINIEEV